MTPEELTRLARVEARQEMMDARIEKMDEKLDQLVEALSVGKGAWMVLMKVGAVVVAVGLFVSWLADRAGTFLHWLKGV